MPVPPPPPPSKGGPPPPPPGGGPKPPPKAAGARKDLLGSIEGFKSGGLKKTVTNDRSAPVTTAPKPTPGGGGGGGGGGMFAGGVPKLPSKTASSASMARDSDAGGGGSSGGSSGGPQLGGLFAGGVPKLKGASSSSGSSGGFKPPVAKVPMTSPKGPGPVAAPPSQPAPPPAQKKPAFTPPVAAPKTAAPPVTKTAALPKAAPKAAAPPPPARGGGGSQARALYAYSAQRGDELSFSAGDIITVVSKNSNGWWSGSLNAATGLFPANYVEEMSSDQPQVRALHDYTSQRADEHSFRKGDILTVIEKKPNGWWRGTFNGRVALYPGNYVQEL